MNGTGKRPGSVHLPLIIAAFAVGLSACGGTVTVTVRADNDAPVASAGTDRTVDEGASVTLDGSGSTDPEGGMLTFAWTQTGGSPTVTLGGANTARPTFTAPQLAATADLKFRLTVTDPGGLSATDTVTVTVRADNGAPVASAGTGRTVDEGASVTLDGSGSTDPEGGMLTFAWTQTGGSPTVTLSGAATARPTFTAPQLAAQSDLTFSLTVTDPGGLSATDTVTVTVRADNDAPVASAGTGRTVDEGASVTLDGSGSTDPEGGALTFAWTQTGGSPTVTLGGAATARPTFTAPQLPATADLKFRLTVTDPGRLSATDTVTVTVRADNDAPVASAGTDRTVDDGSSVTLDGSGSTDPEGGMLTFAWTQTGGSQTGGSPTVTLRGANTARPTFTAPQLATNADLKFRLTVTDPGGLSATDTVTITVRADYDAPVARAGADRTTDQGDSVTLDGSGSIDPEGGTLAFAWTQTGGTPLVTLSGASTATPTFTAPQVTADTALTFTLTATASGGLSATDSVTVTVRKVRPAVNTVRAPASGETLEPASAGDAGSWRTAEYTRSNGLGLIRAAEGYAARTTGQPGGGGVTVAVFGTKIQPHPDLAGTTTYDINSRILGKHEVEVAGIVAARRNGTDGHGVAYNANLVGLSYSSVSDLEASFASMAGLTGTYARGISSISAASAHIGVISKSYNRLHQDRAALVRGLRYLADQGRILVTGLGNLDAVGPGGLPATAATENGIAGHVIVVGSLNQNGTGKAAHSNTCGSAKRWCLFAPGENVYTTSYTGSCPSSPACSYGSTVQVGTSFAAPHVGGAAAVVWAAFPNKTGRQIVDRLLTTARQVDTATGAYDPTTGLSDRYGHGALDLGAAMNPVGFTSMSLPSGMAPVRGTSVRLPPGARVRADPVLADAIVYDEQGFPFLHDLNGHFLAGEAGASSGGVVGGFLEPDDSEWTVMPLGDGASFSFAGPADPWPARGEAGTEAEQAWSARESSLHEPMRDYRFSFTPRAGLALTVGRGAGAPGLLKGFSALPGSWDLYRDGLSVRPFAAFAGQGLGVGVDWQLGRTSLGFATRDGRSRFGASRASLASLGLTRHFGGGLTANASWGVLRERGARLGMRSFGGFGTVPGTSTNFIDVSVEKTVFGGTVLFGSYSRGTARARGGTPGGLVQGWGEFRADALALGVEVPSVLAPSDRVTATVTAPFRPRGKVAEVLVPVREESDGVVEYALRSVDLASVGREVRGQLVYEAWSADDTALTVGGWTRFAQDDASPAERDWGVAMKIRRDF